MPSEEVLAQLFASVPKQKRRRTRSEETDEDAEAVWAMRQLRDRPNEQCYVPTLAMWQRLYVWPLAGYVERHGWPMDFGITPEAVLALMENFATTRL